MPTLPTLCVTGKLDYMFYSLRIRNTFTHTKIVNPQSKRFELFKINRYFLTFAEGEWNKQTLTFALFVLSAVQRKYNLSGG